MFHINVLIKLKFLFKAFVVNTQDLSDYTIYCQTIQSHLLDVKKNITHIEFFVSDIKR